MEIKMTAPSESYFKSLLGQKGKVKQMPSQDNVTTNIGQSQNNAAQDNMYLEQWKRMDATTRAKILDMSDKRALKQKKEFEEGFGEQQRRNKENTLAKQKLDLKIEEDAKKEVEKAQKAEQKEKDKVKKNEDTETKRKSKIKLDFITYKQKREELRLEKVEIEQKRKDIEAKYERKKRKVYKDRPKQLTVSDNKKKEAELETIVIEERKLQQKISLSRFEIQRLVRDALDKYDRNLNLVEEEFIKANLKPEYDAYIQSLNPENSK
jgi:hypothetical protein